MLIVIENIFVQADTDGDGNIDTDSYNCTEYKKDERKINPSSTLNIRIQTFIKKRDHKQIK